MSSEQLTLHLRLKSTELEKQVRAIEKAFKPGSVRVGVNPQAGQFKKLNQFTQTMQKNINEQVPASKSMLTQMKGMGGSLLKLGGIAVGIATLGALAVKSSGVLQGTFKLMKNSITLLLKPIADFLGLLLRPVMILLLTEVIHPFYTWVYPIFKGLGTGFGADIKKLVGVILDVR